MARKRFFDERLDQSEIKARIVQKYFDAWARIIIATAKKYGGDRIAYIDLYAGPGRYKDGAKSTPLLVLEKAIADRDLSKMLVTYFNDADANHSAALKAEIEKLPGIRKLTHKPHVETGEVGEDAAKFFAKARMVPSFTFFDPYGYKGLSLQIIQAVIKDWGCDSVFFFNYNRINAGISNPVVDPHIDALFGKERADRLRKRLPSKRPEHREALILEELANALKEMGGKYVLPFRFRNESGARTSHFLIFVSKNVLGYTVMKQIMAAESSVTDQGVASFTYSPADESTPLLFSLSRPLDALEGLLLRAFAGRHLTMKQIFERHQVDTPYLEKNYKDALRNLEAAGKITCDPPANKRLKRQGQVTFADHVMVHFPRGSS